MDTLTLIFLVINNIMWMVFFVAMLPKKDAAERNLKVLNNLNPLKALTEEKKPIELEEIDTVNLSEIAKGYGLDQKPR